MIRLIKFALVGFSLALLSACGNHTHVHGHDHGNVTHDYDEHKVSDRVFFALDSSTLDSSAMEVLNQQIKFMQQHPNMSFVIEGHCDERGTREYNIALGERRAYAAKKYLVEHGVDANRLTVVSYGKERPAVLGSNEWAWSQNRRAVTISR